MSTKLNPWRVVLTPTIAFLALTACSDGEQTVTGSVASSEAASGSSDAASDASKSSAAPTTGELLYDDPLEDDRFAWDWPHNDEFGSATFENGDAVWRSTGRIVLQWNGELEDKLFRTRPTDLRDVVLRAEATIEKGGGVVGIACRVTPDTDADFQWYEFVVRNEYAAIRRSDVLSHIEVLKETKDVSVPLGKPMKIEGRCVNADDGKAQLTFWLDGKQILEATDGTLVSASKWPALVLWTFPVHEQTDVRWHHFSVYKSA